MPSNDRTPKPSRRAFLAQIPRPAQPDPSGSPLPSGPTAETTPTYLLKISRPAMACEFVVHLNADGRHDAADVAMQALDLLEPLEQQMSVFRPDSYISRINQTAAARPQPVEPGLFGLLERAKHLHQDTDGAFDITTGPLSRLWGFLYRHGRMPSDQDVRDVLSVVGSEHIVLDPVHQTIHFDRKGVEINLGGIGKGYALDCCARHLQGEGIEDFLVHGGFSSVLASGVRRNENSPEGWLIAIRHPLRPGQAIAHVWLRNQSLSTSGCGTQYFHHQGKRYGHILDPRTGVPAEGVLSATAITTDAASADALSTAFYVMGVERTEAYCSAHPGTAAILVVPGAPAGTVEVHGVGLDEDQWQPCSA